MSDDEPLPLSSLQHWAYCPRQCGLIHLKTTSTTIPRLKTCIQTNDVDLDYRGLAYISDRAGTGLHVVEYLG